MNKDRYRGFMSLQGQYIPNVTIWNFFGLFFVVRFLTSAFNLGGAHSGITTTNYSFPIFTKSLFPLRNKFKAEGVVKNLVKEKRKVEENFKSWPIEFQEMFKEFYGKD